MLMETNKWLSLYLPSMEVTKEDDNTVRVSLSDEEIKAIRDKGEVLIKNETPVGKFALTPSGAPFFDTKYEVDAAKGVIESQLNHIIAEGEVEMTGGDVDVILERENGPVIP